MVKSYSFVLFLCTILLFGSKSFASELKEKIPVKKDAKTNTSYINSVTDPGWSYTCKDGIEVELISQGIKNNIPAELTIPETGNVERIVVEIVYKGKNPGATINIEDADGNLYAATREVPAGGSSSVWYYRTELPATSKIKYTNTTNKGNAQSMLAYVFRKKNNGLGSSGTFTAIGGYNNIETVTIPITTDDGPRTVEVELPISELTPDGRYIHIEVSAADGSFAEVTENINSFPNGECCIKVFKLTLSDVAGTVEEIEIKIDTRNKKNGQSVNGQSWVMGGSVKTDVYCSCVKDDTPPEPDAISLEDLTGECSVEAPAAPTATDNCAGPITGTTTTVFPVTTPGTTVVTWTFTDPSGNSSTQTQEVIVTDATAPIADAASLADITDECSASAPTPPTATDNCDGTVTGTTTTTFPVTTPGTTVVTWTFTDSAGNSSTQTQNIIIDDVTAPNADAASLVDLTGECSVSAPTAPTATDNCNGTVTGTTVTTFPVTTPGTTVVTWTFTDNAGNSSSQTQNIIIDDVTTPNPDAASLADLTGQCSVSAPTAPTATDNCDGTITGTTTTTFPVTTPGTTVVTWTFTDNAGNSSMQTQNITIEDVTAPTPDASSLTDLTGQCSISAPTAPTATDNCDGTITGTTTTAFPVTTGGTTVITWTFTDSAGNSSTQTQNIIIEDVTAPTPDASNLADLTGGCSVPTPTAPTATDNCDGTITGTTTVAFPVTTGGTTVITWTFTDSAGNSSTQTQNIIIEDVTAPSPDASSLPTLTGDCSVSAPAPPTASDNCDFMGPIVGTTTTVFPVTTQGTTVITWTFTDAAGNSSTQTQNVVINDVTPPTPDNLEDHILAFDINDLPEVTFSDNCSEVTEEYDQYFAQESCWAGYGPLNEGSNIIFNSFPFDKFHHWEEGYFQKFEDGTAKVHGRVVNNTDTTSGWIIEIFFERLVDFTTWATSGGIQPGDPLQAIRSYANVDFNKPYTIDGFGSYAGANLTLLNSTPQYMDIGPRDIYGSYGMGFQISYEGSVNGQAIGGEIDQFIEMISSLENCVFRRGILLIREWTVTDEAGNTAVYIQRVELEE